MARQLRSDEPGDCGDYEECRTEAPDGRSWIKIQLLLAVLDGGGFGLFHSFCVRKRVSRRGPFLGLALTTVLLGCVLWRACCRFFVAIVESSVGRGVAFDHELENVSVLGDVVSPFEFESHLSFFGLESKGDSGMAS